MLGNMANTFTFTGLHILVDNFLPKYLKILLNCTQITIIIISKCIENDSNMIK